MTLNIFTKGDLLLKLYGTLANACKQYAYYTVKLKIFVFFNFREFCDRYKNAKINIREYICSLL